MSEKRGPWAGSVSESSGTKKLALGGMSAVDGILRARNRPLWDSDFDDCGNAGLTLSFTLGLIGLG